MSYKQNGPFSKIAQLLSHLLPEFMISSNLKSNTPSGFVVYPDELLEGKPHRAKRFYKGEFALESGVAKSGATSPFSILPPHPEWQNELLSFTWLRDLRALEKQNNVKSRSSKNVGLSTIHARSLIADWVEKQNNDAQPPAETKARRLISWFVNAEYLLKENDGIFEKLFLTSLDQQIRSLSKITPHRVKEQERLTCLTSLCFAYICLEGMERTLSKKVDAFKNQITKEILPDGGHISRNPEKVITILLDFLPLLNAYEARNKPAPKELINAVDRMFPMLRFFLLGDNGVTQFNGAHNLNFEIIKTLLKADSQSGKPLTHARHSGYHRIHNAHTVLLFDSGETPPRQFSSDCHASALSFEMSYNKHRLIINCGGAKPYNEDWREVSRATAAHSTLTIDDTSHSNSTKTTLPNMNKEGYSANSKHSTNNKGSLIEAHHTGYVDKFGIIHERRIYLSSNGKDLRGEDTLRLVATPKVKARNFAIRLHLHPDVKITKPKKGQHLHLLLPNKAAWSFSCSGAKISHEESIYVTDTNTPRKCRQIVLHGPVRDKKCIKWALKLSGTSAKTKRQTAKGEPTLPFEDGS